MKNYIAKLTLGLAFCLAISASLANARGRVWVNSGDIAHEDRVTITSVQLLNSSRTLVKMLPASDFNKWMKISPSAHAGEEVLKSGYVRINYTYTRPCLQRDNRMRGQKCIRYGAAGSGHKDIALRGDQTFTKLSGNDRIRGYIGQQVYIGRNWSPSGGIDLELKLWRAFW